MPDRVRQIGPENDLVEAIERLTGRVDALGNTVQDLMVQVKRLNDDRPDPPTGFTTTAEPAS